MQRGAATSGAIGGRRCAARLTLCATILLLAGGLLTSPAAAQAAEGERTQPPRIVEMPTEALFDALAASSNRQGARPYEAEILRRFHRSGSDTADLLLSWAAEAIRDKEYGTALDLLDRIIILQPQFAEAWNKRATVHFMTEQFGKAISDIERTLALEPRHFGALSGLGVILREVDRPQRAMDVLRQALAIHPHLEEARKLLERLESRRAGRDI